MPWRVAHPDAFCTPPRRRRSRCGRRPVAMAAARQWPYAKLLLDLRPAPSGRFLYERKSHDLQACVSGRERAAPGLVQPPGRPAAAPAAAAGSGDHAAGRSGEIAAALRPRAGRPGGEPGAMDRDSRGDSPRVQDMASLAAGAGHGVGTGAEDPGADLFQGREPQPARQPQAQHGGRPGVLQPAGGHPSARHGDGCGAMGLRLGLRLQDVQRPLQGLHGQSQLPAEALPTLDDAPLGRRGHGEPFRRDGRRPANAGARSELSRQPGHRHQRGGGDRR